MENSEVLHEMNRIREKLKILPDSPGVYSMIGGGGAIIYIGKASSLKRRVRSYFVRQADRGPRLRALAQSIEDFEYIACASEVEALILECSLIKQHMPRYNVRFRDDKKYPYVRLSADEYPGMQLTRSLRRDGSGYYGPFADAYAARRTVKTLARVFRLRRCKGPLKARSSPCLYYHISQCSAPCAGRVSSGEYSESVEGAKGFLSGRGGGLLRRMEAEMAAASKKLDFEKAAVLRDTIAALNRISEKQDMETASGGDEDYVSFTGGGQTLPTAGIMSVRGGRVVRFEPFPMDSPGEASGAEILSSFIKQRYALPGGIPPLILTPEMPEDAPLIEEWLGGMRGGSVRFHVPRRGRRKSLLEKLNGNLALKSAESGELARKSARARALRELASLAGLSAPPELVYCFDAAHISGQNAAGSAVAFKDGFPFRAAYRRFRLQASPGDDCLMLEETVTRRFRRAILEGAELPSLVVVDGGRAQAGAARAGLDSLGLAIPVIGLAKRDNTVYREAGPAVKPDADAPCLVLLKHLRDEAHRAATSYHSRLRAACSRASILDRVGGLGAGKKRALLREFGDTGRIAAAKEEELQRVHGIGPSLAARIKEVVNGE